jgi:hypothetical protein
MPTPNRQNFVMRKTRTEFKASVGLTDPDEIKEAIRSADTNLDSKRRKRFVNMRLYKRTLTYCFRLFSQPSWSKQSILQNL